MTKANKTNILFLGLVSFINDTSSKIILPILPLFIKEIGGGGLAVGLISGLGETVASLLKMLAGYWSDKIGKRKPFVFIGYTISSLAKLLFAFTTVWPQILILRVIERFGKGLRSAPRDAILAASTQKENRGRGFGIHRAFDSGGAVLGAFIALLLFWFAHLNFQNIFLIAGILALPSIIPLFFVQEEPAKVKVVNLKLNLTSLSKPLKLFILIATLFTLANFSYMFFVLKSQAFFQARMATAIPIILYIFYNTAYTLLAIPSGIISDKTGRKFILFLGYSLFALICLGFIYAQTLPVFIILFLLLGLDYALIEANQRAFVSDLSSKKLRGTALGVFHMFTSLASLPAGLIAGYLWNINPDYPFLFSSLLAAWTAILFVFLNPAIKPSL